MKLDDIRIYDSRCICPLKGNNKVAIVADTTINKKFECIRLLTKTNEYIVSLVDEEIIDQEVPKDVLKVEIISLNKKSAYTPHINISKTKMVELTTIKPRTLCPFIINLSSWEENTANTYKLQAFLVG